MKQFFKDGLLWGFILWLIGYILGIVFFAIVPPNMIGWAITPIGVLVTVFVLLKKIKNTNFNYYILLGVAWSLLAIILDYFLLVKVFKPADGYYKLDVYVYYALTFALPLIVGWYKKSKNS